jgi:2-oxoglutarate ferredoxin oxidoreductase subunit alpha
MVQKRLLKKLPLIKQETEPPFLYGDDYPEILLTGWGSTYGVMKEVVDILSKNNDIAMLHFSEMYPFPLTENPPHPHPLPQGERDYTPLHPSQEGTITHPSLEGRGWGRVRFDYLALLNNAKMSICIENNATGQFARLMRAETGYEFRYRINKYDGRPFTVEGLLGEVSAYIGRL